MQPTMPAWAPWLTLFVGAVLATIYVLQAFRRSLNTDAVATAMRKLLVARNLDRALKLCSVAPEAPHLAAVRAALEACRVGVPQGESDAGYRDVAVLTSERVLAPVRSAYDLAFDAVVRPLRLARVAAGASLTPLFLTIGAWPGTPGSATPAALAAFALVMLAWALYTDVGIRRARAHLFEALAQDFEAIARDPAAPATQTAPTGVRVRFEVSEPGRPPREVDADVEIIKIGASANSQVRLEAAGVARLHAIIERTDERFQLIDLGAAPQTRVNGEAVNKRELRDGDTITVGEAELRVRLPGS